MARKKKAEEHENLERWLVSYADFMTLLFATFVVLYGLAQTDVQEYAKLEESIKAAFNVIPMEGGQNIFDGVGNHMMGQGYPMDNDAFIPPMLEYLSQKYEKQSMESIKKEIDKKVKEGDMEDVEATITDRGLVITLKNINVFFPSGSAQLTPAAKKAIGSIGAMIKKKFNNHLIKIEGHTDNLPVNSSLYPSNWELSAARSASVARFLISQYNIKSNLFTVIGYGDTKPIDTNSTPQGRDKNRRIEIVILKNQYAKYEPLGAETIDPSNNPVSKENKKVVPSSNDSGLSDAAKELLKEGDGTSNDEVIILDEFNKPNSLKIKKEINDFEAGKMINKEKVGDRLRKK